MKIAGPEKCRQSSCWFFNKKFQVQKKKQLKEAIRF